MWVSGVLSVEAGAAGGGVFAWEGVVFDGDVIAVGDALVVLVEEVEGSFGATLADGFEFSEGIGEGHE